jgi:hypothetical protein
MAMFPSESAIAAANHVPLKIFPVPQAYAAFTSWLDERNASFLNEPGAPRRILFEWAAIDNRHPLLDVPAWSLAMLRHYDFKADYGHYLLLERRQTPRFGALRKTATTRMKLGETVRFENAKPAVARIHLSWNVRGKLSKFFYKAPPLRIQLSGRSKFLTARAIPETLADGILVNFEPDSRDEFRTLIREGRLRDWYTDLLLDGPALADLEAEAEIEWFQIEGLDLQLAQVEAPPSLSNLRDSGAAQKAAIDVLGSRGSSLGTDAVIAAGCPGFLPVEGWAVDSATGKLASAVYLDIDGVLYPAGYGSARPDVAASLGSASVIGSGFKTAIPQARFGTAEHTLVLRVVSADGRSVASGQLIRFRCR